jgi:phosphoglycerate dehydrogenase-like enzyme
MTMNGPARQAPVILLSDQAAEHLGPAMARLFQDQPYRIASPSDPAQADGSHDVDIAFISRDVTGKSSKSVLTDTLLRFYDILRHAPRLAWVHGHSAGADRPIYPELRARGVTVTTSSGANAEAVAQMILTGVLALNRRLPDLMDAQRRRAWEPLLGQRAPRDLAGQTALIVGLGPIGQEAGRLLKMLRMQVIGVRRSEAATPHCDRVLPFGRLDEALPLADWLILACPLTEQTRGLFDAARLARLPAGAFVVNVARGEVAVEADLAAALASGALGGAFLDVFETEPLAPQSPLWGMHNVMISPHTAGHTSGHYAAVGEIFLDNLARWRGGQAMRNLMR